MELYFKDVEAALSAADEARNACGNGPAEELGDTAQEAAFAELAERVLAARSIY